MTHGVFLRFRAGREGDKARASARTSRHCVRIGLLGLLLLLTFGCSNRCQNLCESWYQLELKCEQLGLSSGMQPASCLRGDTDPQLGQQRSDFSNRQCRQDFREATCGQLQQCCSVLCVDALREEWASITGTEERDFERKRDICQRFQQLGEKGSTIWCDRMRSSCMQEAADGCATSSPSP